MGKNKLQEYGNGLFSSVALACAPNVTRFQGLYDSVSYAPNIVL